MAHNQKNDQIITDLNEKSLFMTSMSVMQIQTAPVISVNISRHPVIQSEMKVQIGNFC